jgi:hypothetical protein
MSVSSPLTPTPTTSSNGNGGSTAKQAGSVTMQLQQQYVSTSLFNQLGSVVTDPKGLPIYALTKSQSAASASPVLSLVALDPTAFKTGSCA